MTWLLSITPCTDKDTSLVTPCSVRLPFTSCVILLPASGTSLMSIGVLSAKVAFGNLSVSIAWRLSWPSRGALSLLSSFGWRRFCLASPRCFFAAANRRVASAAFRCPAGGGGADARQLFLHAV